MFKWIDQKIAALLLTLPLFFCQAQASFVTCHVCGQLGNQLFEVATTLAYAWDHNVTPYFPELHSEAQGISYNREHMLFRVDASSPPRPCAFRFNQAAASSSEPIPDLPDLYLFGYFQSWKYFHHHREKILPIFAPSDTYLNILSDKYQDLLDHPNTVAIHVRVPARWKHEANLHPFVGLDYYKEAMAFFPEDTLFVVFSDRIHWCKRQFTKMCKNVVFIEGNDHITDLYLMSKMKHVIVGTSSFSWWGAYMNENPERKIFVPSQWMHENYVSGHIYAKEYYPPEWTILPVTFGAYPEDLEASDLSLSLDDN